MLWLSKEAPNQYKMVHVTFAILGVGWMDLMLFGTSIKVHHQQ
jgi:hypothetical protein